MFKTLLMPFILGASLMLGQEAAPKAQPEQPMEAAIIPVKTLSGDSFNRLSGLLGVFKVSYRADDKLRAIIVYAPKDVVAQIKRVVEELDKPGSDAAIGRNIELTMSFLRCSNKPSPTARALPPELEAVAKQIRAATQYKDVQLWDIVPMHIQEGKEVNHSMRMPLSVFDPQLSPTSAVSTANIRLYVESIVRKDTGRYVRFDRVNIGFKIPYVTGGSGLGIQWQYTEVGLNTAGEFKDGQKTVLGKVSGIDDESAIFVVLAPKILD